MTNLALGFILEDESGQSEYGHQEFKEFPVFGKIAAGHPMFINPTTDEYFSLPGGSFGDLF